MRVTLHVDLRDNHPELLAARAVEMGPLLPLLQVERAKPLKAHRFRPALARRSRSLHVAESDIKRKADIERRDCVELLWRGRADRPLLHPRSGQRQNVRCRRYCSAVAHVPVASSFVEKYTPPAAFIRLVDGPVTLAARVFTALISLKDNVRLSSSRAARATSESAGDTAGLNSNLYRA